MSGSAGVAVLVGARGEPEAWSERADGSEAEAGEASGLVGLTSTARTAGPIAWAGLDLRVLGYLPEGEGTLVRLAPALGARTGQSDAPHASVAGSWALEWLPTTPDVSGGRAEASARAGVGKGGHTVDGVLGVLDHRFLGHADWALTSGELGAEWSLARGVARVQLRPSGQQLNTAVAGTGGQGRLAATVGASARGLDASLGWQGFVARGGGPDPAYRPPFDPLGSVDEDADALSAGGFVQQRVEASVTGAAGDWTATGHAVGRLRTGTSSGTTAHLGVDVARALGPTLSAHLAAGWTGWRLSGLTLSDPYGWLSVEWSVRRPR